MKHIKTLGLMVVAVFALSAVAASTASAALEWLDNGKPITVPVLVLSESVGKLLLQDLAATGGSTALECTGNNHGTVGPGVNDTIKSITATGCSFVAGKNGSCEASKPVTANAVHLPWASRLLLVGGVVRDMIESSGAGNPGWVVECTVAGIFKVQDECTSSTGDPLVVNLANDVHIIFHPDETASCSLGNATSGMVVGLTLVFGENRSLLKISVDP